MVKGKIHSYHTLTAIDGPGLRFLLFLQGCPLRCMYCHNPDSWKQEDFQEERTAEEILEMFDKYRETLKERIKIRNKINDIEASIQNIDSVEDNECEESNYGD